jgi:hypothetical protein
VQAKDKQIQSNELQVIGPEWLAHRYEESTDQVRFVDYDRATRASVPFLIDAHLEAKPYSVLKRDVAVARAPATAPIHFIFHSGFCCSTLLAACFDQPGIATGFSEPTILNDIVGYRQRGAAPSMIGSVLDSALTLLARPFAGDQASVVKPSNIVNGLASAIMKLRPDARAILIHAPVEDFVTSIARKRLTGRLWGRTLYLAMRRENLTDLLGFNDYDTLSQTDLQVAACAWLGQQALFAALIREHPDRVRSISSERFLADPEDALRAGFNLFDLDFKESHLEFAMTGTMHRDSKTGKSFGLADRRADYELALQSYGEEIQQVSIWAAEVAKARLIELELEAPLR